MGNEGARDPRQVAKQKNAEVIAHYTVLTRQLAQYAIRVQRIWRCRSLSKAVRWYVQCSDCFLPSSGRG